MDAKTLGQQPANAVFPETGTGHGAAFRGVTKRELFAAMAMHQIMHGAVLPTKERRDELLPMAATVACEVADALLAELAKDQP